jgi:hypothetical protein
MTKKIINKVRIPAILGFVFLLVLGVIIYSKFKVPNSDSFDAPGKNWNSPKKVENYFVERLHMTPLEASEIRSKLGVDGLINLRLNTNVTLDALVSNLYYYGFVKDEAAFRYALMHTKDVTTGQTFIKVDDTRTIDTNAEYRISENMTAWQIADILLNRPSGHFSFDEYNYFFMP